MKNGKATYTLLLLIFLSSSQLFAAMWIKFGGGYDLSKNFKTGGAHTYESNSTGTSFEASAAYFPTHFKKVLFGFGPYYYGGTLKTKSIENSDGTVSKFSISPVGFGGVLYVKLFDFYLYGGYANYKANLLFDKYINQESTLNGRGYHGGVGMVVQKLGLAGIYVEGTARWINYERGYSTSINGSTTYNDIEYNQFMYTVGAGILIPINFNFLDYVPEEAIPDDIEEDGDKMYEEIEMEPRN